jgi:hypothetical protein
MMISEQAFDASVDLSKYKKVLILGGGCFGWLFSSRIERAQSNGLFDYEYQMVVDINPECEVASKKHSDRIIFTNSDYIDFFIIYFNYLFHDDDYLVMPCNTPHFIYHLFRRLLCITGNVQSHAVPVEERIGLPFESYKDDTLYMSYADWQCLSLCREPAKCPAIRMPRAWDLKKVLRHFVAGCKTTASAKTFFFEAEHYINGVAVIKAKKIIAEYRHIRTNLTASPQLYGIATLSACHGALSLFNAWDASGLSGGDSARKIL